MGFADDSSLVPVWLPLHHARVATLACPEEPMG